MWRLTLLSDRPLRVGWNRVYYQLEAAQTANQTALLTPTATLSLGSQSLLAAVDVAPAGDPWTRSPVPGSQGFVGALTFPQPGLAAADWALQVVVSLPGQASATFDLGPLAVGPAPWVRSVQAPGDKSADKYLVALHFPAPLRLGTIPYWLAIYRQQGPGLPFLPLPSARVEVALDMPSMGHTAGQLSLPQWFVGALQQGQLTLTMPGEWRLTVHLYDGTQALSAVTFAWKV